MDYNKAKKDGLAVLVCLFLLIVIVLGAQWFRVLAVNDKAGQVLPGDTDSKIKINMRGIEDATDRWNRELPSMNDPNIMLSYTGTTFGCEMENTLDYDVINWSLRMNIKEECYFNGAWGGTMEFHQFRNGKELVDSIDSNEPDLSTLKVEYNQYAEPMLIHMMPGDYLVFIPSKNVEMEFNRNNRKGSLIMNWYYQDTLSLADYEFNYTNDMKITDGMFVYYILPLVILWVIFFFVYIAMIIVYKQTKKGLESHYSGISMMAGIYDSVCLIDIENDSYHIIKDIRRKEQTEAGYKGIQEHFASMIAKNVAESYRVELSHFLDVKTIKSRIENKQNLVCEFKKVDGRWGILRIVCGTGNNKTILVLEEDITDKKDNMKQAREYLEQFETDKKLRGNFYTNLSYSLEQLIAAVHASNNELKSISQDPQVLMCAEKTYISTEHLRVLQNSILDMFAIESGNFALKENPYSIKELTDEVSRILTPFHIAAPFEYAVCIDEAVYDRVHGDSERIKQILILILFSALVGTKSGSVKLIVYGKSTDNTQDIIFSVKDTSEGMPEEFLSILRASLAETKMTFVENAGFVFIKIIDSILREMDSKLNIVSVAGDGTELYFTIRQEIVKDIKND